MSRLLDGTEKGQFLSAIQDNYEAFKVNNGWNLTEEMEDNYKEGVLDVFDAFISASSFLTFDMSSLRQDIESIFDEMDRKENDEL